MAAGSSAPTTTRMHVTYLGGELLTRSLSSGGLAGGLLGTGHYCGEKKEQNVSCGTVLDAGDEEETCPTT